MLFEREKSMSLKSNVCLLFPADGNSHYFFSNVKRTTPGADVQFNTRTVGFVSRHIQTFIAEFVWYLNLALTYWYKCMHRCLRELLILTKIKRRSHAVYCNILLVGNAWGRHDFACKQEQRGEFCLIKQYTFKVTFI